MSKKAFDKINGRAQGRCGGALGERNAVQGWQASATIHAMPWLLWLDADGPWSLRPLRRPEAIIIHSGRRKDTMMDHVITVGDLLVVAGFGVGVLLLALVGIVLLSIIGVNAGWFR